MRPTNSLRSWGQFVQGIGIVGSIIGACGLIVAAALPWATLTIFRTHIDIPGVLGLGLITASIGLLALAQFGFVRRFPYLGIVLGGIAFYLGSSANKEVGGVVMRYLLHVEAAIAPLNARLAQIPLPPIEPFGDALGSRKDHTGVGPLYTEYAGATLIAGSVLLLGGGRLRRTCRFCKHAWSTRRGDDVAFCPHCGKHSGPMPTCPRCASAIERHERFCVRCGENLFHNGNKNA